MLKECKKHGLTQFGRRTSKRSRCKKCQVEAVQKRRFKVKQMAVDLFSGKCEDCKTSYPNCVFEFHHLDPNEKDFSISHKGYTLSWERVKAELAKCVMLCANCHRIRHKDSTN